MKTLYLIGGTMGVGKTTVCQALKKKLDKCVFLDGDWCWDADPFVVTEETKKMVLQNITFLLSSFLSVSAYENVVFCWVMHESSIIDAILSKLDTENVRVMKISLMATPETLTGRLSEDIADGKRQIDVLERSLARLPLYEKLDTLHVHTDNKTKEEVANEIAML